MQRPLQGAPHVINSTHMWVHGLVVIQSTRIQGSMQIISQRCQPQDACIHDDLTVVALPCTITSCGNVAAGMRTFATTLRFMVQSKCSACVCMRESASTEKRPILARSHVTIIDHRLMSAVQSVRNSAQQLLVLCVIY
jgi:hypothetical protein